MKITLKSPTEAQEQAALFKMAALCGDWRIRDLLYAIPNGGFRNPREARNLVSQGVRRGMPDICLPYPITGFSALYIELKRQSPKGKTSGAQWVVMESLIKAGNYVEICYGWEHAWKVITNYLG